MRELGGAALQLAGLGQLLQGAPSCSAPRCPVRAARAVGRRPLEPRRGARSTSTRPRASRRSSSTTAGRSPSRTRSSGTSATARASSRTTATTARRCCSGCSSSSTSTSRAIAVARFLHRVLGRGREARASRSRRGRPSGYEALDVMETPSRRSTRTSSVSATRSPTSPLRVHARRARGRFRPRAVPGRSGRGSTGSPPSPGTCRSRSTRERRASSASASPRARPARSTSATRSAPSPTARTPTRTAARSCCGSTTPTPTRNVEGGEEAILADLDWLGIGVGRRAGPAERARRRATREAAARARGRRRARRGRLDPARRHHARSRPTARATYQLATVVDDLDLGITHIIRGSDHRPNEDVHQRIARALGGELPEVIHHGLLLGDDGKKLSKRADAASVARPARGGHSRGGRAGVPRGARPAARTTSISTSAHPRGSRSRRSPRMSDEELAARGRRAGRRRPALRGARDARRGARSSRSCPRACRGRAR